jgi:imidazolonepropionase
MNLTFEEALVGATINAAYALDRHERIGSLEPGKQMDAVIVNGPAVDLIRVGAETIRAVVKKGRLVIGDGAHGGDGSGGHGDNGSHTEQRSNGG